jgi:hypothetical protein
MSIQIHELRLSYAWLKSFARDTLLPSLASSDRYKEEFELAKQEKGDWLLPWRPGERQHFWQYYLGTALIGDLASVDAERAWRCLMPLRAPSTTRISTGDGARITLEGYAFPHSVGVLGSVFICPAQPVSFDDIVEQAVATASTHYNIAWKGTTGPETHGTLASLADLLIDQLHGKLLGQTPHGKPLKGPITTATVIDASIDGTNGEPGDGAIVDRALDRLCRLDTSGSPDPSAAATHDLAAHERMVTVERGRAVWVPKRFSSSAPKTPRFRALGCYHRNLSLAALQAHSLTSLLRRADDFLPSEPIPPRLIRPVKSALVLLDALYHGIHTTYRSLMLQSQLENHLELMERVGTAAGS